MPKYENTILFVVHEETAEGWANRDPVYHITREDSNNAKRLLSRLKHAKPNYARVIQFEFGPKEPLVPSTSRFTWEEIVEDIGGNGVDIVGLRRTECVAIVCHELTSRLGSRVTVKRHLTID